MKRKHVIPSALAAIAAALTAALCLMFTTCDEYVGEDAVDFDEFNEALKIVAFNKNDATGGKAPDPIVASKNESVRLPDSGGLTKSGYFFNGWNYKIDGSGTRYPSGSSYTVSEDVIFYAQWTTSPPTTTPSTTGSVTLRFS
jgi:hypothetical protein